MNRKVQDLELYTQKLLAEQETYNREAQTQEQKLREEIKRLEESNEGLQNEKDLLAFSNESVHYSFKDYLIIVDCARTS